MRRKLMDDLIRWKSDPERLPLLLEGARQVGKTFLLKEFGRENYQNTAYVNFQIPAEGIPEIFEGTIEPDRIISLLELALNMEIKPGKTLIVFDEIQEAPRALESLKYFAENAPEYHIAGSGSLLGIFLHKGTSYPVGKVNHLRLEPMDFGEFLLAKGEEKLVAAYRKPDFDLPFRERLLDAFREYCFTGGMPKVVGDWVEKGNYDNVNRIQSEILADYRGDFSKHTDEGTAIRIRQVFDQLPAQFAKNTGKFLYGAVKSSARAREYELALEWLQDAGIVRRVQRVERGDRIPLKSTVDSACFKLYFLDVGLFRQLADIPSDVMIKKSAIFDVFNGLIAEQYVLQQLASHRMYYWSSGATSEVDFVTQVGGRILPIEVKSGENVKAKSLRVFREKYRSELALRFSLKDMEYRDGLLNIPLYYSFLFEEILALSADENKLARFSRARD